MNYYSITLRKNSSPIFISDYREVIRDITDKYPTAEFDYCYEECPTSGDLHLHGMIKIKGIKLYRNNIWKLIPKNGWSIDFGPVQHFKAWQSYFTKCDQAQARLENKHTQLEQEYYDWADSNLYLSDS